MAIFEIIRNAMLAGFGMQERMKEFVDDLVKKGELSESQGARLVKEWSDKAEKNTEDMSKSLNEVVSRTLQKMNLSTKEDIQKLHEKMDSLSSRVAKMESSKGGGQDNI